MEKGSTWHPNDAGSRGAGTGVKGLSGCIGTGSGGGRGVVSRGRAPAGRAESGALGGAFIKVVPDPLGRIAHAATA